MMQRFIEKIYSLQKFGIKLGLDSSRQLLQALGAPQRELACAHIAGTNGKGSVGAMLEAIALNARLKTGYYISPHLVKFNERFRLNGQPISDAELLELGQEVWGAMGQRVCTFFEFTTALAFLFFARHKVDLAIMETGMGGRLDATNLCQPVISIITSIGLDHQQYLGRTLKAIALDKAGILKPGVPLLHGVAQPRVRQAIEQSASQLGCPVYALGREVKLRRRGESFYLQGLELPQQKLVTNLRGYHQVGNAALAAAAASLLAERGFAFDNSHIQNGLQQVNWPGRLERMQVGKVPLWLDGAHNPAAVKVLLASLPLLRQGRKGPLVMVLGIMADKDLFAILRRLLPAADQVVFSQPDYDRACPAEQLARLADQIAPGRSDLIEANLNRALKLALERSEPHGVVLVTGSLFTVGQARALLTDQTFAF